MGASVEIHNRLLYLTATTATDPTGLRGKLRSVARNPLFTISTMRMQFPGRATSLADAACANLNSGVLIASAKTYSLQSCRFDTALEIRIGRLQ